MSRIKYETFPLFDEQVLDDFNVKYEPLVYTNVYYPEGLMFRLKYRFFGAKSSSFIFQGYEYAFVGSKSPPVLFNTGKSPPVIFT